jgi:hypothetical protein
MKEEETFTLTPEAAMPYMAFADVQAYFDSLSLQDFEDWNIILSGKVIHEKLISAALAIYMNETGNHGKAFTALEVEKICETFEILVGLAKCARDGTMKQTGRMMLSDDRSGSFKLTAAGKRFVENMIRK